MKLAHAVKVAEKLAGGYSQEHRLTKLTTEEQVAVRVLVAMAKRVLDTRSSLRAVVRAVYGEDLNQVELAELFDVKKEST
jgi:DNA-directed RNA polymerase specialized sigma24 family protein